MHFGPQASCRTLEEVVDRVGPAHRADLLLMVHRWRRLLTAEAVSDRATRRTVCARAPGWEPLPLQPSGTQCGRPACGDPARVPDWERSHPAHTRRPQHGQTAATPPVLPGRGATILTGRGKISPIQLLPLRPRYGAGTLLPGTNRDTTGLAACYHSARLQGGERYHPVATPPALQGGDVTTWDQPRHDGTRMRTKL